MTTWSGVVYVAFVIDAFSRRIVGWKADTNMRTELVLDTLEMALWSRDRDGIPLAAGHDQPLRRRQSQYTSFAFTTAPRSTPASTPSVGSVGDAYDNALAETTIGLYKTEKIHRRGPWKTLADVELATLEWVDWYNHERLHSACDCRPPAEYEELYLNQLRLETQ